MQNGGGMDEHLAPCEPGPAIDDEPAHFPRRIVEQKVDDSSNPAVARLDREALQRGDDLQHGWRPFPRRGRQNRRISAERARSRSDRLPSGARSTPWRAAGKRRRKARAAAITNSDGKRLQRRQQRRRGTPMAVATEGPRHPARHRRPATAPAGPPTAPPETAPTPTPLRKDIGCCNGCSPRTIVERCCK